MCLINCRAWIVQLFPCSLFSVLVDYNTLFHLCISILLLSLEIFTYGQLHIIFSFLCLHQSNSNLWLLICSFHSVFHNCNRLSFCISIIQLFFDRLYSSNCPKHQIVFYHDVSFGLTLALILLFSLLPLMIFHFHLMVDQIQINFDLEMHP